jgi:hypothetical protein
MFTTMTTTDEAFTILVTVPAGTPSRDWLRVAIEMSRKACRLVGADWLDAEIVVELPEAGRYFTKSVGDQHLHGNG